MVATRLEEYAFGPQMKWIERDGVLYFPVQRQYTDVNVPWIDRLQRQGHAVHDRARDVLRSPGFAQGRVGVERLVILRGTLVRDVDRKTGNLHRKAVRGDFAGARMRIVAPDVTCLVREKFTNEDLEVMGVRWLVFMHEPIKDSSRDLNLFSIYHSTSLGWQFFAYYTDPEFSWGEDTGFVFGL